MKIECVQEKIKESVVLAEKMTGKNLTLPVLSSVLLTAKGSHLKIRATNLELGIEITIPAKVIDEGSIAVPGSILNALLSNIYNETVTLETKNKNLFVTTKTTSTIIKSHPHDDFPTLPSITKGTSFAIESQKLVSGLRSVWYSASMSDIKPEIASINIHTESDQIVFVATDSFRLAEKKIHFSKNNDIDLILIPGKNAAEIVRVFEQKEGDVTVTFNANQISFANGVLYFTSRIIDGVFPDYKQIIPKDVKTEATMLKQDFLNALKMTNLFSDKFNQVVMTLNPAKKLFQLQSHNADVGENTVNAEAALSGEAVKLSFNSKYLFDCLQSIIKDSIVLQFNGETKPLVVRGVGDRSFMYLVMPLNQ